MTRGNVRPPTVRQGDLPGSKAGARAFSGTTLALPILIGEHELTVDEKNRLLIPAQWRRALDLDNDGLVLITGLNGRPWIYTESAHAVVAEQVLKPGLPTPQREQLSLAFLARANPLKIDKQGRVVLPEKILRRTQTHKDVSLLGVGDHMEIWNRDEWETFDEQLGARMGEIAAEAKQNELYEMSLKRD